MSEKLSFKKIREISAEFKRLLSVHHGVANVSDTMDRMGIPSQVMLGIQQFTVLGVKFAGPAVTVRGIVHRGAVTKSSGFKYILEARDSKLYEERTYEKETNFGRYLSLCRERCRANCTLYSIITIYEVQTFCFHGRACET